MKKTTSSSDPDIRLEITPETIAAIYEHVGQHPAERGGMLGSDNEGVITHFFPDSTAECSASEYTPDIEKLNRVIREWKKQGIRFQGFVHSHPAGFQRLSNADKEYARDIMSAFKGLAHLALPLVMTEPDAGDFQLIPFVAVRDEANAERLSFQTADVVIATQNDNTPKRPRTSRGNPVKQKLLIASCAGKIKGRITYYGRFENLAKQVFQKINADLTPAFGDDDEFPQTDADRLVELIRDGDKADRHLQRVQTAYDASLLNNTRLVIPGVGGAAQLAIDSARAGFGEFVLIDPDTVSESNIGTQSADPRMIGTAKVDALAAEIRRINPRSAILTIQAKIEDLSDSDFEVLCHHPLRFFGGNQKSDKSGQRIPMPTSKPQKTILLVLTDNFEAQARGHRLGLQFGLPTICAQEYREGRGAEITFTVPGVTPACHRCITASRYKAYLSQGYRNDVTSHGAPIFAAQMLNAVLGHVLLAVVHHDTSHPRFGKLITQFGKRNLVLLRMDPNFDNFLGWPAFARPLAGAADPNAFVMFDSIFLPQGPDRGQTESRPVCPDCGGSGDLRNCIGTFADTRIMRTITPSPRRLQPSRRTRPSKRD